jgi:hypothetical protein
MSVAVSVEQLFAQISSWGFGYLVTVSDDARAHVIALTPVPIGGELLRFDAGGGRACRNASMRRQVSIVFPPAAHSDGFSLIVDGEATVDGSFVDVRPTSAVLHRPAP